MDRALDPQLTARFGADLAEVWSEAEDQTQKLGVAVSGGPDSVALLLLAHAARSGGVEAATIDHGLRAESAMEAQWVGELCRELGVPHETIRIEVGKGNTQSRAREARYNALDRWMDQCRLAAVATAHHADDQAETLLMRLNRGSGLSGLAGVRPSGSVPGGKGRLLRPLLGWRKSELEALVRDAGIAPVADPSNSDDRFDRVRIRQAMSAADWLDPLALARSAALLGGAEAALEQAVDRNYRELVTHEANGWRFAALGNDYLCLEVVRRIFAAMGADAPRSEIARLVARLRSGDNASLAGILALPSGEDGSACWTFMPEPPRRMD